MIKCEMHLHTAKASGCGKVEPKEIAKLYNLAGYKAITVTNHYMKYILTSYYPPLTEKEQIKYYLSFYKNLQNCCAPYGIKVFLGLELNPECMNTPEFAPAAEFLCYGVTEQFLYNHPRLYDYTQKELFDLFNKNGILMFQSHPFRYYCVLGDLRYMHGMEVYNGHPFHDSNNKKSEKVAKENNLLGISGSDFHEEGNTISGGILIPENINNSVELANYIKNNDLQLIRKTI